MRPYAQNARHPHKVTAEGRKEMVIGMRGRSDCYIYRVFHLDMTILISAK
jgi:hypothetical protein